MEMKEDCGIGKDVLKPTCRYASSNTGCQSSKDIYLPRPYVALVTIIFSQTNLSHWALQIFNSNGST